ncbi:hypothetical protein GDO78_005588 [Eleutherodactylus coqui]|uniref:Golgin subfamily B member 1 n=1 Tax=Eleutherodactylus coqui TaxID=57060 RepID=A0A8J6KEY0_ELECQ|nr:hypothetical protein GDO78_005588 [Eleutherodactylus coqui]
MSEDQMERLAHYEKLVVQLKDLIQHKDVELKHKDAELQQKEIQIKSEREAVEAKFTKLKLQAKAKVTTLNKQIEELKRTAADQTSQERSEDKNGNGGNVSKGVQDNEDANSKQQDGNEVARQLQESQSSISALTKQLSESQETILSLTKQLQDSQELTKSLQEREDAAKKQEFETPQILRALEEKNEALHSRNQVVEMLEQELQSAELQKQVLSEQFREMEQELLKLRESLVIEQKERSQQAELHKDLLKEREVLFQQLQEAFDKEKDAASEKEGLKLQLEKVKLEIQVEQENGAQEELERLRAELTNEKGAQAELQQLKEQLEREKNVQEELQQLREELEREKGAQKELQQLREELEREKGAQEELQQLRKELEREKGAEEELQQLREELDREKGAQEELQQLREELEREKGAQEELKQPKEEFKREKGAQGELQQLKEEREKGMQEEFQQPREELEREKGVQEELQQPREEFEREKGAQEELKQLREELEREKGAQEELNQLKEQLKREKSAQEELKQLREELEREKGAQEELNQLREQLERETGAQEELQQPRKELERDKGAQEEVQRDGKPEKQNGARELQHLREQLEKEKGALEQLQQVRAELEQHKESQAELQIELERLKKANQELLIKPKGCEQDAQKIDEPNDDDMEIDSVKIELQTENKRHAELSRMKEQLKSMKESTKEFDHLTEEIEKEQKILNELERMKQEIKRMREAQSELDKLQEEHQLLEKQLEQSGVEYKNLSGQGSCQEEPLQHKKDVQTLVSFADLNTQHYTVATDEDSVAMYTGICQESEVSHQVLQSSTLNVQTHSVSQELVLDVTVKDAQENQLSILMLDLLDTQEEINKLKGELPVEGDLNECALSEQVLEKSKDVSDEANTHIQIHDSSDPKYQNINADKDAEIISMKKMVAELQSQIKTITFEKEQISFNLETLLNRQTASEKVQPLNKFLEVEEQQLTAYENQNILVEQVKSLENEFKSKDLKITALQKDLDHMNLLMSEQNELSKLQENQLEEKEQHLQSLKEMLNLSHNKEERLSEELATNEREKVLLQELLSQKTTEVQALQESISEKNQQVEEISHSLSDKMVLLNEEKYSMSKEIKALKEQLNSAIQDETGKGEELLQALRTENTEIHLQMETITKEKQHLQERLESVQIELAELNSHLKTVELKHAQSQEMIKIAQEEREMMQLQLQDQKCEFLKEHEELQNKLDTQINDYVQQLQLLTEKQQNSLEVIDRLQGEKSALESQLQSHINKSQHDAGEVELSKNEELQTPEELQTQLEDHKQENELLKRKLQAALISRKELNRKISKLEKQMVNCAVNQDKDLTSSVALEVKSLVEEMSEQNITEDYLKQQLSDRESDLETVRKELADKSATNEKFQNLIEELTLKLKDKSRQIESLIAEQTERTSVESQMSDALNTEDQEARIELENRITILEQDKEVLQKKVQEVLHSRRDTIKKVQEKDRHHREQLKQQKEDFNVLQEKYEKLQLNQKTCQTEVILEERGTQTIKPCLSEESQNTMSNMSEDFISVSVSEENAVELHLGKDWVDFSPVSIEDPVVDKSVVSDVTVEDYRMQMEVFQSHKNELELKALQLEEKLNGHLEEISHMQNTIDQLNSQLQNEKEKNLNSEVHASTLIAELESSHQESSHLTVTVQTLKEELMHKKEEIGQLQRDLEVVNVALKNADMLLVDKDDVILALKTQLEVQTKEYEEHHRKLEMQSLQLQNKPDEEMEEAKGKQQLQRKLQAALISRKEALKENKTLKLELDTLMNVKVDLSSRLQLTEGLVNQLTIEKDALLKTVSGQKDERDKLIAEIDKCLLENQNLEASCESLKLALAGITQDKENLTKELESGKLSHISQVSEWQEKLTDLQKEYETLLQSYENVSNETDRMKRAMETVRQEKQELFSKIKSVETEKKEVEKQLEDAEQEIESMKEKMRKFAKSKQQKILELEEENDRLRGEMLPAVGEQMYEATNAENSRLKEELDKVHSEKHSLILQLEQVKSEKYIVAEERESLRLQLNNVESNVQESLQEHPSEMDEEVLINNEVEVACSQPLGSEEVIGEQQVYKEMTKKHEISPKEETLEEKLQMKEHIKKLESNAKIKENEIEDMSREIKVLMDDKLSLETQLRDVQNRVTKMEIEIVESEKKYHIVVGDLDEVSRQKHASELEKDELEERLMNQMAELNGSIGNFQQDAIDSQVKNDCLQKELENLKFRFEEEKRQLERQKVEALSGAQKEYVEKLKAADQSVKGRKTQSKELQELLKEKQHEVRHLQKDCIQYQETISGLERAIKALEFERDKCEAEKLISNDMLAKAKEDANQAQNDLASFRVLLDDTQSEAARVLAENLKLKGEVRTITENTTVMLKRKEEDMERRLDMERDKHMKQILNLQEKINVLQQENEDLKGSIVNLQRLINEKDQEMKDLQGNLNQNIARLAAFTRSMCSLQNDRDRVLEESKTWSEKFTDAMQKKDIEINDKEKVCVDLQNELLHMTSQLEELKIELTRLQTENKELVASQQTETEVYVKTRDSLLEEKAILSSALEEEQKMHSACQQELRLRTQETSDGKNKLKALEIEVDQIKSENEKLLGIIKRLEAEAQNWKLNSEQIQSDLQASKSLVEQLHKELEQKEQDVVQLLNSRDEAVSTAVGKLHDIHAIECKTLEDRLKETEKEKLDVQDKIEKLTTRLKASQEEVDRSKGQLESFTKSMCSLQEERERVLSDYQQLEQRHLDGILVKDGLIQEAATENNKLHEELRLLRSRTDDLNAQNAKLNAQLTRYREDLKELISLKDSQLKQLLGEKLQEIEKLRHEQSDQEQQMLQEKGQREILQQELDERKLEKQKMLEELDGLKLRVSELLTEIGTQGKQLEEVHMLKDELIQVQKELTRVQEESSRIQVETEQKVQHAEAELNKKLQSMQHDTGILRNETETAEERVAELAKDLMESEQLLLTANEEIAGLKAQLQAFEGSIRSLQDSHDLAQEEIQRLQEQLTDVSVLNTELGAVNTEKNHLYNTLSESKEQQHKLETQLKDLIKTLQAREEEITRLASELDISQKRLQNSSEAMVSLQQEHNGLQAKLKAPRVEIERSLQSPSQRETRISSNEASNSAEELQTVQIEVQNLHTQLSETLKQVHLKDLRIQQMNSKLSQIFEEKNAVVLQLRGSNQHLRDATSRCSSLERQLQELQQKNLETLPSDSAPGGPQEKKEPQMETDQQLLELQARRRSLDWSTSRESAPHELSLLIETHGTTSVKTQTSSLRRLLRFFFCSRTKAPLLFSVYLLLIHVLLFLCFTGHL